MRLRQQEQFSFMGVPLRVGSFAASPRFAAGFTLLPLTQPQPGGGVRASVGVTVRLFVRLARVGVAGRCHSAREAAAAARIAAVSPQPLRACPLLLGCMIRAVCLCNKVDGKRRGLIADSRNCRPEKEK